MNHAQHTKQNNTNVCIFVYVFGSCCFVCCAWLNFPTLNFNVMLYEQGADRRKRK
jgi:hypothetical protein